MIDRYTYSTNCLLQTTPGELNRQGRQDSTENSYGPPGRLMEFLCVLCVCKCVIVCVLSLHLDALYDLRVEDGAWMVDVSWMFIHDRIITLSLQNAERSSRCTGFGMKNRF